MMSHVTSNIADVPETCSPAAGPVPTIRSDVQRNRGALLQAARELFAERSDVPMYEVARRAGVGQATLYRHFPDRRALVAAVAEEVLAGFERGAGSVPSGPEAFATVLHLAAELIARSGAFTEILNEEEKSRGRPVPGSLLHHLMERFLATVDGPLEQAKAAGAVSAHLQREDVILMLAMVRGALDAAGPEPGDRAAVADRAVKLALYGVVMRPTS